MLSITSEQLATFDRHADDEFVGRVCRFLRREAAAAVDAMDDPMLASWVAQGRGVAQSHGVRGERGIVQWLLLGLIAGPRFHQIPQVAAYLADERDGDRAVATLHEQLGAIERRND